MAKKANKQEKELLVTLRERHKRAVEADQDNRRKALEDMRFCNIPGEQWDPIVKNERGTERPYYEFNKVRISVKRVINDMRSNRPQGKVRAFEDGDKDTAEVYEGLCRNIWNASDGDSAIDSAAEYQVTAGIGAWRINTKYSDDTAFDQDIVIEAIRNPFCLYADPASKDALKRDARYWLLTTKVSKSEYETRWPDKTISAFEGSEFEDDDDEDWADNETVRVCEYWYKEPYTREIALLSTGQTVDLSEVDSATFAAQGIEVIRTRTVQSQRIKSVIASGEAILEGPSDWAGSMFPFVQVHGECMVVDGKTHWFGLVRFAKDAQRAYNVARTSITETIALAPNAKFWATHAQAEGNTTLWSEAHRKLYPYMLYNPDAKAPGPPVSMPGAQVPIALIQEAQIASDEIKAVTGIFDASLGNRGNETTGVAIRARQAQGEIATFNYMDNMAKGIRRTWEILIDLIPKIYDTERSVRILGADGAEKYAKVNQIDPATGQVVNDLGRGKYDVAITVGPSYTTQRQEAVEAYTQIGQAQPALYQLAGDIIFRNMDLPGAEQIAERLKAMLPPQIQQTLSEGKPIPPEAQAMMAQAQAAMQQVQQHGQLVQQAAAEAEEKTAEAEKAVSDLKVQQAQFEAQVQKQLAALSNREAQLVLKEAKLVTQQESEGLAAEKQQLVADFAQANADIQAHAAQLMQQAIGTMAQIQAANQPQVYVTDNPKPKVVRIERRGGALIPIYEGDNGSGRDDIRPDAGGSVGAPAVGV